MLKKLMLLAFAVGALAAFAAPAASAHVLTNAISEPVPVNTTITATSTDTVTTLPEGRDLTCEEVIIHGKVLVNNGTTVQVGMDEANDTAVNCHITITANNAKIPVTVTPTFEELHLQTGGLPSTAKFSFLIHVPDGKGGTFTCNFESIASTVTPFSGTNELGVEATVAASVGCAGGTLHGTFKLAGGLTVD